MFLLAMTIRNVTSMPRGKVEYYFLEGGDTKGYCLHCRLLGGHLIGYCWKGDAGSYVWPGNGSQRVSKGSIFRGNPPFPTIFRGSITGKGWYYKHAHSYHTIIHITHCPVWPLLVFFLVLECNSTQCWIDKAGRPVPNLRLG